MRRSEINTKGCALRDVILTSVSTVELSVHEYNSVLFV